MSRLYLHEVSHHPISPNPSQPAQVQRSDPRVGDPRVGGTKDELELSYVQCECRPHPAWIHGVMRAGPAQICPQPPQCSRGGRPAGPWHCRETWPVPKEEGACVHDSLPGASAARECKAGWGHPSAVTARAQALSPQGARGMPPPKGWSPCSEADGWSPGRGRAGQPLLGLAKPSVQASKLGPWAQGADTPLPHGTGVGTAYLALLNFFS